MPPTLFQAGLVTILSAGSPTKHFRSQAFCLHIWGGQQDLRLSQHAIHNAGDVCYVSGLNRSIPGAALYRKREGAPHQPVGGENS